MSLEHLVDVVIPVFHIEVGDRDVVDVLGDLALPPRPEGTGDGFILVGDGEGDTTQQLPALPGGWL